MWLLENVNNKGVSYSLLVGKQYVVGRKDCEILVENDQSISRKHAVFHVSASPVSKGTTYQPCTLNLKDSSKYGTTVNGEKINEAQGKILKDGDQVAFGILGSSWSVKMVPLMVTMSCLKGGEKSAVKGVVAKLSGQVVSEWETGCTHLVMSNLTVTSKAVCALVAVKPIVTPAYFQDWIRAVENNGERPHEKDYLPDLAELILNKDEVSFLPMKKRRKVFQGKKFLFSSVKQHKKLQAAITLGGGEATIATTTVNPVELLQPNVCVMNYVSDANSQPSENTVAMNISSILKKNLRRTITESEIGLAVVYCSTEKYCNPDFDIGETMGSLRIQSQSLGTQNIDMEVHVPETPMSHFSVQTRKSEPVKTCQLFSDVNTVSFEDNSMKETDELPSVEASRVNLCPETNKRPRDEITNVEDNKPPTKLMKMETQDISKVELLASASLNAESTSCMIKTEQIDSDEKEIASAAKPVGKKPAKQSAKSDCTIETSSPSESNDNDVPAKNSSRRNLSRSLTRNEKSATVDSEPMELGLRGRGEEFVASKSIRKHAKRQEVVHVNGDSNDIDSQAGVVVELALLVVRRANNRPQNEPGISCSEPVRNFKKFKKVKTASAHKLPIIIGGADLFVYIDKVNAARKPTDSPTGQDGQDDPANEVDFFDLTAPVKSTKRKRRR